MTVVTGKSAKKRNNSLSMDITSERPREGSGMNRQKGFTLIELLTAMGLAALLLSMAIPALDSFTRNARQTGAVNDFVASLHIARSTAVTTNARVTICSSAAAMSARESVGTRAGSSSRIATVIKLLTVATLSSRPEQAQMYLAFSRQNSPGS